MNSYELAKKIGMLSEDEVREIKYAAAQLPENPVVVVIGANVGTASMALIEQRPDAYIFSIDPNPCPEERKYLAEAKQEIRRVVRILDKSQHVGVFWPFPVDMVIVDGDHNDDPVRDDIQVWKPHVKPGGYMLFHDYKHPNLPRLPAIVEEAMADWVPVAYARYLVVYKEGGDG